MSIPSQNGNGIISATRRVSILERRRRYFNGCCEGGLPHHPEIATHLPLFHQWPGMIRRIWQIQCGWIKCAKSKILLNFLRICVQINRFPRKRNCIRSPNDKAAILLHAKPSKRDTRARFSPIMSRRGVSSAPNTAFIASSNFQNRRAQTSL